MAFKFSHKSSGKSITAVGGAVSSGTLPRGGNSASRGNVAKNKRTTNRFSPGKIGISLAKKIGSLATLPLRSKSQPPLSGEDSAPRESVSQPGKSFIFALSLPQLLGAGGIVALLLVWAFFLGILTGRGMENRLPLLAEKTQSPTPVQEIDQKSGAGQVAKTESTVESEVLMPENLRFLNDLNRKSTSADVLTSTPLPTDIPQLTAVQKKISEESVQNSTPDFALQPGQIPPSTIERTPGTSDKKKAASTPGQSQQTTQNPGEPQFEYIFQVAASTDLHSVQELQTKLQKAGLTVSVEHAVKNNAPLYRVLITLRGSQEESQALRAKFQQLNLQNSFLRSKKNL